MKTLMQFWHWYENEGPPIDAAFQMARRRLSPRALDALELARERLERRVAERSGVPTSVDVARYAVALRRASTSFVEGFCEIDGVVSGEVEAPREPTETVRVRQPGGWYATTGASAVRWREG